MNQERRGQFPCVALIMRGGEPARQVRAQEGRCSAATGTSWSPWGPAAPAQPPRPDSSASAPRSSAPWPRQATARRSWSQLSCRSAH
eukprot:1027196-Pyramimonas_sp.AAC.1